MGQAGVQPFAGSQKGRCGCGSGRCCLWLFKAACGVARVSPGAPKGPREVVLMGTGKSGGGPMLGYQFVGPWRNFCGIGRETGGSQVSVLSPSGRRVCFSSHK